MSRFIIWIIFQCAVILTANGQQTDSLTDSKSKSEPGTLAKYEDSLKVLGDSVMIGKTYETREAACVQMIPLLVKALKEENSFDYPFDSLETVSIIKSRDGKFRIFSWQLLLWDASYRYFGAIQMNSKSLELIPLIDMSLFIPNPLDTILDNDSWYGAVYYNVVAKKYKGTTYYTLFGWDGNDAFSTKKLVDVLHFKEGKAIFGAPIFNFAEEGLQLSRFIMEYKKSAGAGLNYEEDLDMIVYDYLVPDNPLSTGVRMSYIPDGTYEGFEYKNGIWYHIDKIFHQVQDAPPDFTPKTNDEEDPFQYKKREGK